jgi:hypothetical protein
VPEEAEMLTAYCAAIRAGIYKRALDGTAANAQALAKGMSYRGAAAHAWRLAQARGAA